MIDRHKFKVILILIGLILFFQSLDFVNLEIYLKHEKRIHNNLDLKNNDFWTLSGISINGNDSWANSALNSEWCSGSGNWSDPYIIQNVTIDGQNNSEFGILIRNSDVYFKIINCTVSNVKKAPFTVGIAAIKLINVKNGFLINNSCSFNERAILLENSENLTIIGNDINNNDQSGLHILYSDNNTISNNNILNTRFSGIYQSSCKMNVFHNNSLEFNSNAFNLDYSNRTTLSKNIIKNNKGYGIYLRGDVRFGEIISFNEVQNNIIENNSVGIGLSTGHNFKIYNNTIKKNRQDGMRSTTVQNSYYYNNLIINNTNYGMWFYIDSINNTIENNIIANNTDGLYFYMRNHNNTIFANDIINNINIGIKIGGENNTIFLNNFSQNGYNAQGYGYWDNGSIGNYWDDYDGYDINGDGIGETPYKISGGQDNYPLTSRTDTFKPIIIINYPINFSFFGNEAPVYLLFIDEYLLDHTWYTLEGVVGIFSFNESDGRIDQEVWDNIPQGEITITFYAEDRAGNIGNESVIVIKSISNQPEIPGYNISIFLLGIFSAIIILIVKKMKKTYKRLNE